MIDLDMLRTPLGAVAIILVVQSMAAAAGKDLSFGY